MNQTWHLYFSHTGTILYDGDDLVSYRLKPHNDSMPEELERRAWFNLGRELSTLILDGVEFLSINSYHKVIDQLDGAVIDDPLCVKMAKEIKEGAFSRFIDVTMHKITKTEWEEHLKEAVSQLGGASETQDNAEDRGE